MKQFWSKYVGEPFRETLIEVPWFGPVISAVVVAMVVEFILDGLGALGGLGLQGAAILVLTGATVTFVLLYQAATRRRRGLGLGLISDLPHPDRCRGLIFLYSVEATLREAVKHHQPIFCWLIVTPEKRAEAQDAIARLQAEFPATGFETVPTAGLYDTRSCYDAVKNIYEHEGPRLHLNAREIISDITGGTKPMTMGMIVACLDGGYAIEHVPTEYTATGRPKGPLPPIEIRVHSSIHQDRED